MRITLAYPYDGHEPDETIEVLDAIGRRLIHHGRARRPADEPADTVGAERAPEYVYQTARELRAQAEAEGAAIPDDTSRAELIAVVIAGEEPEPDETPLEYMTVKQLHAYAQEHDIVIPSDVRKRVDLVATLRAAQTRDPEQLQPGSGTEPEEAPDGR